MNLLDRQYQSLLQDILDNGVTKSDRTGTGTISIFGRQIRHKMSDGFPLLTTKKMPFKTIVTELLWFLRGDTNIKYLVDNGCHIWDGDAWKRFSNVRKSMLMLKPPASEDKLREYIEWYEQVTTKEEFINKIKTDDEFAKKWGELGPIYGKQWRSWEVLHYDKTLNNTDSDIECYRTYIDQIQNLINDLKTNPDSRRLMVTAWNPAELDQMVLPPCHYGFQVYTRELSLEERKDMFEKTPEGKFKDISWHNMNNEEIIEFLENIPTRAISLMWNQRSVDTFLGLPFNIASYGLLLEIIAKAVNMVPDELIGNLGDVHLYSNHVEQAKEQIGRDYSVEERLELLYEKEPDFDASKEFGIARDIQSFCHYMIDDHGIPRRTREPLDLPKLNIKLHFRNDPAFVPEYWLIDDFELVGYTSHSAIKAPLSN